MNLIYKGKTKDIYQRDERSVVLKFKDDVTGLDGKFDPGANEVGLSIKGMGHLNLALTTHFFQLLQQESIPTHFIEANLQDNTMAVNTAKLFGKGLEVITRFKATGSFIRRYGNYIEDGTTLDNYVEFTLKDDLRQDPLITREGLIALNIMSESQYQKVVTLNNQITNRVKDELEKHDFDLFDIKLEFGFIDNPDNIVLIDEISGGNMRVYKDHQLVNPVDLAQFFIEL